MARRFRLLLQPRNTRLWREKASALSKTARERGRGKTSKRTLENIVNILDEEFSKVVEN
jgi:hypothetical protein